MALSAGGIMARSTPNRYPVELSDSQRGRLEQITRLGRAPARKIQHARVLLLSDRNRPEGPVTRDRIGRILGLHVNTVDRIRRRFVLEGETPALNRKLRETPPTPPKFDGRAEAQLVAICCGPAPTGRVRWTLRLLVDELVKRKIVTHVAVETVRKALKKTNCNLGASSAGASRSGMRPASSPKWKKSSISTKRRTTRTAR
jgi:transposase-like protein